MVVYSESKVIEVMRQVYRAGLFRKESYLSVINEFVETACALTTVSSPSVEDCIYFFAATSKPKEGFDLSPVILIGIAKPPCLLRNKGSSAFRKNALTPVVV